MLDSSPVTTIHEIADMIGMIVSLPLLIGVVQIVRFIGKLEQTIVVAATELNRFSTATTAKLEKHDGHIEDLNGKMSVLWDGHERRKNRPDNGDRD